MGILKSVQVLVDAAGANATAAGNTDSESFIGFIEGIYFNQHANAPATTDIIVIDKASGVEIASIDNSGADQYQVPRIYAVDNSNAALTSDVTPQKYAVSEGVNIDIQDGNVETNHLIATVIYSVGT